MTSHRPTRTSAPSCGPGRLSDVLAGFDTEYRFRRFWRIGDTFHGDVTTFEPVCACLVFEDGREIRITERWEELRSILEDHRYTFVVHGCHAESLFCERVRILFPTRCVDTLLMAVMLLHAKSHEHSN